MKNTMSFGQLRKSMTDANLDRHYEFNGTNTNDLAASNKNITSAFHPRTSGEQYHEGINQQMW